MDKQEEINELFGEYKELLGSKDIGSEQVIDRILDTLGEIEDILYSKRNKSEISLEVRSRFESLNLSRILGEKAQNIDGYIDEILGKIEEILNSGESIEEKLANLGILHKKLKATIIPTDGKLRGNISGNGNLDFEKEKLDYSKINEIIGLLHTNEIYTDDYIVYSGENEENMMRETSYIIIMIPKINRSIAVCDEYGEATFITRGARHPNIYLKNLKKELVSDHGAYRLINNENSLSKLEELLFHDWETKEKISLNKTKKKLSLEKKKEKLLEVSEAIDYIVENYNPEELMSLSVDQFKEKDTEFKEDTGLSFTELGGLLGVKENYGEYIGDKKFDPRNSKLHKACLLQYIYGEGIEEVDVYFYSETKWKEYLSEKGYSAEELMSLSVDQFKEKDTEFKEDTGLSFTELGGLLGVKENYGEYIGDKQFNTRNSKLHRACLLQYIYGKLIEKVDVYFYSKAECKEYLSEKGYSAEELMSLSVDQFKEKDTKLKEDTGLSFVELGGILDIKESYGKYIGDKRFTPTKSKLHRACLLQYIYGEGIEKVDLYFYSKAEWKEYLSEKGYLAEELMSLSQKEFKEKDTKLKEETLLSFGELGGILNIKERYGKYIGDKGFNPTNYKLHRACLLKYIYGEGIEKVDLYFYSKAEWKEYLSEKLYSAEELMSLSQKEFKEKDTKLKEEKLLSFGELGGILDIKERYGKYIGDKGFNPKKSKLHRACLLHYIYGEGIEKVDKYFEINS